jgi:hypothetical protein
MSSRKGFFILMGLVGLVLLFFFYRSLETGMVLFSNDGPLSVQASEIMRAPQCFWGMWYDINWLGFYAGNFSPSVLGFMMMLPPLAYCNYHLAISLIVLAVCAWLFFRSIGFHPAICILASLAAILNSNFFSNGAWGLSTRATTLGMAFLALAAVSSPGKWFAKSILAGFAIGLGIADGSDNGAIFSVYVAAYATILAFLEEPTWGRLISRSLVRVGIMALCAGIMAFPSLKALISTSITGLATTTESPAARWDWSTQWSLPKLETFRVIIPGLYGYRLDTVEGGNYWGAVGQQPGWEQHHQGFPRHSGSGEYAGILVVLVAGWGLVQSLRRKDTIFGDKEKKLMWFWGVLALGSLLLAWGRHAPFYRLIYVLPYFSSVRNPIKFMHPFHMSLLILFGYGLLGLWRACLAPSNTPLLSLKQHISNWWNDTAKQGSFWRNAFLGMVGISLMSWLLFAASRTELVRYLSTAGFDATQSDAISKFSVKEVGLFVFFLVMSLLILSLILSKAFSGKRAGWAWILLGAVLLLDLARANAPWVIYYNYQERYASNPFLDVLRNKPYEHRVTMPPFQLAIQQFNMLQQVYQVEWLQHHFPYYHIQSIDIPQEPRMSADKAAYRTAIGNNIIRLWELTNTRYLFGQASGFVEQLNQQLDGNRSRFRVVIPFDMRGQAGREGVQVVTNAVGPYALIEFTGALPRAGLYSNWEVSAEDTNTLSRIASPSFNPVQTVVVSDSIPIPTHAATNVPAGTVEHVSYSTRKVVLHAKTQTDSVLLLNDKYDPAWTVQVDGKPSKVLRCNFIMRGVYLPKGEHNVTFVFKPTVTGFYVMVGAEVTGLLLILFLVFTRKKEPTLTNK